MNKSETAKFLALVQALDGRNVDAIDVEAWHLILSELKPEEAASALVKHHQTSTYPVRAADIYRTARPPRPGPNDWMHR